MCHMLLMVRVLDIHINVYISTLIYVNMKNVEYCKNNSKCYELMNFLSCPCKFISIFLLLLLICSMSLHSFAAKQAFVLTYIFLSCERLILLFEEVCRSNPSFFNSNTSYGPNLLNSSFSSRDQNKTNMRILYQLNSYYNERKLMY